MVGFFRGLRNMVTGGRLVRSFEGKAHNGMGDFSLTLNQASDDKEFFVILTVSGAADHSHRVYLSEAEFEHFAAGIAAFRKDIASRRNAG